MYSMILVKNSPGVKAHQLITPHLRSMMAMYAKISSRNGKSVLLEGKGLSLYAQLRNRRKQKYLLLNYSQL